MINAGAEPLIRAQHQSKAPRHDAARPPLHFHATMTDAAKLTEIIIDVLGCDASAVIPTARLHEELGADSLDKMELIMAIEEEWGLDINDAESDKIITVQDALDCIASNTAFIRKQLGD